MSYHDDTFDYFFKPVFKVYPHLHDDLLEDFRRYRSGVLPSYFGKDSPYTAPESVRQGHMWHIHLKVPPSQWPQNLAQHARVCAKGAPESDLALVYVQGEYELHRFCLLGVLGPDAHQQAKDKALMNFLASAAKRFREVN